MARVVEGLDETLAALREFYPHTYRQMNKEIRPVMRGLVRQAQTYVPDSIPHLSHWSYQNKSGNQPKSIIGKDRAFPRYNPEEVRRGIKYTTGRSRANAKGWVSIYTLWNKSPVGAIIETAGRVHPWGNPKGQSNNPNAGVAFINAISSSIGKIYKVGTSNDQRGRLIFQAVSKDAGKAQRAILAAINKAKLSTQDRIDRAA